MSIVSAFRTVHTLSPGQRMAVEEIIGRRLEEDETVSVRASKGAVLKEAPTGLAREMAVARFIRRVDETARRAEGVPKEEIEAAVDEAVAYVRQNPQ